MKTADDVRDMIRRRIGPDGSQAQLAREIGISRQYLNAVLQGEKEPSETIANFFGLDRMVVYPDLQR